MTGQGTSGRNGVRLCPPPSKDFDPFTATEEDLKRHGLPLRPDPQTQPDMAALWERKARRYRDFEHLEPQFEPAGATRTSVITAAPPPGSFALSPYESCGYELDTSSSEPFTALFVTWTVPDLQYTSNLDSRETVRSLRSPGALAVPGRVCAGRRARSSLIVR
jgi:hypothetical protein